MNIMHRYCLPQVTPAGTQHLSKDKGHGLGQACGSWAAAVFTTPESAHLTQHPT